MLTFKGFKKHERKSKPTLMKKYSGTITPKRLGVILIVSVAIIGFGLSFFIQNLSFNHQKSLTFDGIEVYNADDDDVREYTSDEIEYDTNLYTYELTNDEKKLLLDKGYTEEEISSTNTNEFVDDLYGREAYIQNLYMKRYKSALKNAKEPTETQREEILTSLLDAYKQRNYNNVIAQFQEYVKTYTFESYLDEPITSLYYDCTQRVNPALFYASSTEEDLESTPEEEKQWLLDSLNSRTSAIGVLYDTFALDTNIVETTIDAIDSDIPMFAIKEIEETNVYDPNKTREFSHAYDVSYSDLVYVYKIKDVTNSEAEVVVTDEEGTKTLIGVWYIDEDTTS